MQRTVGIGFEDHCRFGIDQTHDLEHLAQALHGVFCRLAVLQHGRNALLDSIIMYIGELADDA